MWTGIKISSLERASHGQEHGLAYVDRSIGLQEQLVTRQRRVLEVATAFELDSGPAVKLLQAMEANLAELHAWRLRLLSLRAAGGVAQGRRGHGRRATVPHEQRARPRAGAARSAAANR